MALTAVTDASLLNSRTLAPVPSLPAEGGEQRIQRRLADAIYEHRLPPGTKLPEADLCRIFDASRGTVRKVLGQLAAEQIIQLIPNRGAFVARPSVDETRNVYELRRILESGVVRCLGARARDGRPQGWLAKVRRQIDEEHEASRAGDTPRYIRLTGQFHLNLAAATGNAALEQQLRRVVSQTSLMVALYDLPGRTPCSFHEHREILQAIEDGDFGRAECLMDEHLLACERQLRLRPVAAPTDLAQILNACASQDEPLRPAAPGGLPGRRTPRRPQ